MKTYLGKRQRLRLAALVVGGLLCSTTANAANLVSTIPSDYGNSEMGAVTGSRVTTDIDATPHAGVLKNLNRDPASFGFHQKGKSMILLRQYTYSTTELENTSLIDPNSAGAAASAAAGKTTAVPNMHAAAASDEYIYMTGYDLGQIGVVRQNGKRLMENKRAVVNLKNDIKQYCGYNFTETFKNLDEDSKGEKGKTYTGDPAKAQVHGEALLVDGRRLYVAASVNPLAGYDPYDDGFLMQYDIQDDGTLKFGSYTRISRNIDQGRLNKFNDHILVSCIGGYQHYNGTGNTHYTALNIAKIDQNTGRILGTEQRRASIPNHVKGTGEDMRDLKLLPDGTAYVMTYNLSPSGSQINAHVYKTTMSNLMSEHPDDWQEVAVASQQEGWFGKLNAEYYTKRLWLELGDTLQAYTDGDDTAKHIWQAKDFSDNKAFSRFNKITMIEPDRVYGNTASVVMTLPAELGGDTTAATVNENAVWKNSAAFSDTITTQQSWNIDTVVSIGKDKLGDKSTNVLAAISATDSRPLNINAGENILQLQVENTVGNPTGIYARGADLTVSAKKGINILTRGSEGGNSLTNAVQLDALKNKATKLTINGPLNISMTGGLGGNGVAIQKSDRFGEKSYEARLASAIRINGNLKIAGTETDKWGIPLNRENVFSRFNNAGILTQVEKSDVTVDGDVDMTVYGNGVTTNAKDSSVHIAGGGSIQVPAGMRYSYYALAAYQGAISMNMGDDGTKPGNPKEGKALADVKLDGDLFALPTGRLDVALMTDKSYLHGLVDNGGTANLYLQNGAKWLNEARNERYYQDDEDMGAGTMAAVRTRTGGAVGKVYNAQSHVTNFVGGATEAQRGIIYQKNANPLTIDKYSGHTAAVYSHDAATPTQFKGGEIIIKKANADTKNIFTLFTDGGGVTTGNQSAVLNALANKLSYQSFAENKLLGKLSIGESLTTSTINGEITFGNETGSYAGGTTPPKPPSTEQTKTAFTEQLIQKDVAEYKNANVEPSPGSYKFTKDTTISKTSYNGAIYNTGFPKNPLTIDASGHVLTLKGERNSGLVTGIKNNGENGIAIAADTVKINVKSDTGKAYGVWNSKNGSTIKITGNLDISASGGDSAKGLSASKDATIEADGLDVTLNKASLDAWSIDNDGTIKVNKDGTHKVILRGNILSGVNGSTDLSLTTAESALNGVVHQKGATANGVSLLLTNGAVWNNQDWNQSAAVLEKLSFAGSRLSSLRGGNDANNAGVIFQKNNKDITIDNYSGHTRVFYEHDAAAPTTIKGGDFRIKNASAGSGITLTTDSSGLNTESTKAADKNLVSATLNALANKLWYTAYTTNERNLTGKAEIAEGLTTSSASKRVENITFNETTGQGSYVYTPQAEMTTDPIKESETLTYDRQALATAPNTKGGRIVSGLYTDNTAYNKQHPMVVDMNGHSLHIEANSKNQIASAIHGGNNKYIRIVNSGEKKALTIKASNTDTRAANGIQTEANGHIHIQGDVVVEDVHTKGYNAAAIQTNGTIGSPSDVTIDGDLTVQSVRADRVDTKNKGADDGRNLAALKTTADESKITVKGNVDIQNIKGSVLQTIGADSVIDVGGGTISAAEDADHTKQYRAVRAEKGTVNINTPEGVSGSRKTNITGDMYITREYGKKVAEYSGGQLVDFDRKGVLNVSLTTADSSWTGAATYDVNRADFGTGGFTAHDVGQFNLTLQNGAHWTNEQRSGVTDKWLGSRLSSLRGGNDANNAGVIFQKNNKDITIDNYSGHTRVFYEHDTASPTTIKGGDFRIKNASAGSAITLTTDSAGLNTESTAAADKNLVSATLNALANKLWYTAYTTGERNLTGKAEIAEGLTTSAASKRIEDITFDGTSGQGSYVYTPAADPPASQTDTEFTTSITGDEAHDAPYTNAGVRKGNGNYVFTKDTIIRTDDTDKVIGGPWTVKNAPAISNVNPAQPLNIDLNGKKMTIEATGEDTVVGISAIGKGSQVNVKNAGAITIHGTNTGSLYSPTLFANGGGSIHIENGGENLEDKILTLRSVGKKSASPAVIKTMNGLDGVESNITIDGLVDILADGTYPDGKGANEGVSAVASRVDIGGGIIRATGSAWAAIRAYGEFASDNYGTVNFNVTKGADGLANGAGTNRAVIEGDIVTNGGMGTKGRVSVGLSTANSHWIGNYADTRGYGVTPGQLGAVNLFMKNGSYWKGFSNGSMKVEMSGEGTSWTGFNIGNNMQLQLSDGAIWHNAITQEQKDQSNNPAISRVKYFTGSGGFIDMTGTNRFLASSNSLSGAPVQTGSSSIEEKGLGETGDLTIDEFSGSTTMLYRHDATTPTTIYGGKLTIGKAAAGSLVRMVTDNTGLNTESAKAADKNLVSATLNALANKLWYTAYTTGERNLTGKAEIAEGLTTSSASKRVENITFNESTGQGGYAYTPAVDPPPSTEQTTTEFTKRLFGTTSDQEYIDANVRQADGTYRFTKDSTITYQNATDMNRGAIKPNTDVHIDTADRVLTVKSGGKRASVKDGAAIANDGKTLDIKAKTLKLLVNDMTSVSPLQTAWGIRTTGNSVTNISGMTEIDVDGTKVSKAVQAYGGTVTLDGLRAKTNTASEDAVTLDARNNGRINVNVKNGTSGSSEVMLDGNIAAIDSGSRVDAALTRGTSYLNGLVFGDGTLNLWLQNGAAWKNQQYGTALPAGFAGSRLSTFTSGSDASHAGVIFQKNEKDITIGSYSGYARVFYEHDAATPTTIKGGDLHIKNAAAGSAITLTTDNAGLNTESTKAADKNLVSATLNALANKLWYTAYTTGERNLTGKAEIAEGLTTSSASKRVENITFNESTGQGGYAYTPAVDPPKPPQPGQDEQTTTEFTKPLIGTDSDQEYIDAHVRQADGTYRFTKDSTITYQNNVSGARGAIMPSADVHINAADRVLTIKSGSGIASVTQGAAIANYGKGLDIKAKTLKLLVNGTTSAAPLQTAWGILSTGGTTNISGMTEIDVAGTERSKAVQAYDGTVTLEGLRAKANAASKDAVTLDVQGTGRINVNVKDGTVGSNEVMLDGNITARESGSRVDAALTTGTSYLKGLVSGVGTLNLWLQNGAVWHNEEYTTQPTGFSSRLSNFTGGSDASRAGVIFQKNNNDISIDNYSGYARVFYKHDAGTPTTIIGGDLRIKNAAAGSNITLATDNAGLNTESTKAADKNLVSATLNALANKLWYTAYTTGERNLTGKAEIAEGLTTSSASKRVENITFNESTGQGGYAYTPAVDPPKPPQPGQDEQTTTEFTTPITGDAASDADYVAGHVLKNDTYTFTKNSKITAATGIQAVQNKPIKVQAAGAELKIQAADYGVDAGANSKVAITGKQLTIDAGSRSIRAAAGSDVSVAAGFDLKGAIENNGGRISLKDMGRKSSLVGDITQTAGSFNLRMQGVDSNLKGNIIASGGVLDLSMEGAGATFTGSIRGAGSAREAGTGDRRLTLENRTVWNVTSPSNLTRLNAKQGSVINYLFSHNEGVNVENFKGSATVHYNGTATSDGTLTLANTGKFRIRNVDGTGNALTIATDAHGGSDTADERVAKTLARQFEYVGSSSNIQNQRIRGLSLSALIADGLVSSSKRYNILMEADGTSGDVKPFVSNIEYGDYETKLMKGVKSAMTASTMAWRAEANDLMKRMGDLRLSPNDTGIWARVYRGKSTSNKDNTDFRMNYSTIQVGCDKKVGRDWRVGVAGSYMSGSSAYAAGSGKNKEGNLGVYGTWTGKSGQYVDLIAKIGRLQNEYTVYNDFGHYVKGDYSMWGGSLSAEYGKRISMKDGSFVEPQIELIYSHMQGTNYVGSTDYSGMSMYVHQKPFDSFIGRIGFGFGKETERSTYYARASLYHEFAGDMHTDYSDGFTPKSTMQRGKDTWVGVQLGGTLKLSDKTNLYGNFEKTFGGDIKTAWRMDAGMRWIF